MVSFGITGWKDSGVSPSHEETERRLFGLWKSALLPETKAALSRVMTFVSRATTRVTEYAVERDPIIRDERLCYGDFVCWNEANVPWTLRQKLGSDEMEVIAVVMMTDDTVASFHGESGCEISSLPFSLIPIGQVTAKTHNGKTFVAPSYFFRKMNK